MFRTVPLSIMRSFSLYIQQCPTGLLTAYEQDRDGSIVILLAICQQTCMTLLCVQWKTPDNGQRNCPKHVEFYSKNKFEELVQLVGFIIRIYRDARSPERQIQRLIFKKTAVTSTVRYNICLQVCYRLVLYPVRPSTYRTGSTVAKPKFDEPRWRLQLKCDGTWWRTGGEVKGKLTNGVGSQYPSHYLGTWCIQHYYRWCAHLGCQ